MADKTVLVVGSGGREHALAWALARSAEVGRVIVAPGNAGTTWPAATGIAPAENAPVNAGDLDGLLDLAQGQTVDLTVVGPEAPLAAGIVDRFRAAGVPIFGPTQAAAQIEASKAFAKTFMAEHNIPTPEFGTFTTEADAHAYIREVGRPVVVKASGLAAGKGVIVCDSPEQAEQAVSRMLRGGAFGAAGETIIIEERLRGHEASLLALTDGETLVTLPPARDHKSAYDENKGPNTGGMGAFAPIPDLTPEEIADLSERVLLPVVRGLAERGTPYTGVLYAGLILTEDGPYVLEYNCRFGDPETQAILPLLTTDLLPILEACISGTLAPPMVGWAKGASAVVVLASPGYPGKYPTGLPITGLDVVEMLPDVWAFHAGTALNDSGQVVTAGGRVLGINATGVELSDALRKAYSAVERVNFQGMHYRRDIGVNYAI